MDTPSWCGSLTAVTLCRNGTYTYGWQYFTTYKSRTENKTGLFTGHDPTGGSGQEVFKISRVESSRATSFIKISWVGSDWVKNFLNLTGRVRSGRVGSGRVGSGGSEISRVGPVWSGRVRRFLISHGSGRVRLPDPTRPEPLSLT